MATIPMKSSGGLHDRIKTMKRITKGCVLTPLSACYNLLLQIINTLPVASVFELVTDFRGCTMLCSFCPAGSKLPLLFGVDPVGFTYWMPINRTNVAGKTINLNILTVNYCHI
jgi:hypothetical protein